MEDKIKLWKKLKVNEAVFEFSCGGDSMSETEMFLYDKKGKEIDNAELKNYFDDEVYKRVDFYENSDGHYIGEAGKVVITLNDEGDDFDYSKDAQSEWSEGTSDTEYVDLTEKEIEFINKNVDSIIGSSDETSIINYKTDVILTDKDEKLVKTLVEKLEEFCQGFSPNVDGDLDEEWYRFTTNDEGEDIEIKEGQLRIVIEKNYTTYGEPLS